MKRARPAARSASAGRTCGAGAPSQRAHSKAGRRSAIGGRSTTSPVRQTNPSDDAELVATLRADDGDFSLREVRRAGDGAERVAVAREYGVGARGGLRSEEQTQGFVALGIIGAERAAAHVVRGACLAERQAGSLHGAAERAGEHLADWNLQALHVFAESTGFGAPLIGEVALRGAILEALHARVVLAEIGGGMAQKKDVAALAQLREKLRARLGGRCRTEQHHG